MAQGQPDAAAADGGASVAATAAVVIIEAPTADHVVEDDKERSSETYDSTGTGMNICSNFKAVQCDDGKC